MFDRLVKEVRSELCEVIKFDRAENRRKANDALRKIKNIVVEVLPKPRKRRRR